MFLPSSVYSSTSSENPVPSHSSQTVSTVDWNPSCVTITPSPLHAAQAP